MYLWAIGLTKPLDTHALKKLKTNRIANIKLAELTNKKWTLSFKWDCGRHIYEANLSFAQSGQLTQVFFDLPAQLFAWSKHDSLHHLHMEDKV